MKIKIRCSALGRIMAEPRSKSEVLSVGAKTYIDTLAKEYVYGFKSEFSSRETSKGVAVENESIALLNDVLFTSLEKNTERKENDYIGGTADIVSPERIHDIKSSWSLATFPATPGRRDALYEWQLRGYMMLWDRNEAEIDYCLVDTPDELIGYELDSLHLVSHIDPRLRLTRVPYQRTAESEAKIIAKVEAAQEYFTEAVHQIAVNHNH